MAGTLGVIPWQSPLNLGDVIAGAKLFCYDAGTTTKRAMFTTSALAVQHTNPLVADANGRFAAFYVDPGGGDYKLVLTSSSDIDPPVSPIRTEDNIPATGSQSVPFHEIHVAEISAGVTPRSYRYTVGELKRYGAIGNDSADDAPAVLDWLKVGAKGIPLTADYPGIYNASNGTRFVTDANITITGASKSAVKIRGPGFSGSSADSFIKTTGSFSMTGVSLIEFYYGVQVGALTSEIDLEITNCGNEDTVFFVVREAADCNSVGVKSFVFELNVVDHGGIPTTTATRAVFLQGRYSDARVIGNKIKNVNGRAVVIGWNTYADQDYMRDVAVIGNQISDIVGGQSGAETQGILVYGISGSIIGNQVSNVSSTHSTDCEGIYTKLRGGVIQGNTLRDAGFREGSINIKGSGRAGTSSPQGFALICSGNNILFSSSNTADTRGIHVQQEDVLVENNYIEGARTDAIYTPDLTLNNVTIRKNRLSRNTGQRAIWIQHNGTGCYVTGNEILDHSTRTGINETLALYVDPLSGVLSEVDLNDNTIRIGAESTPTTAVRAIQITRTNAINNVRCNRNRIAVANTLDTRGITLSGAGGGDDWEVLDNKLDVTSSGGTATPFAVTAGTLPTTFRFSGVFEKQTTSATQTIIGPAFTLPDNTAWRMKVSALAKESDHSNRNSYNYEGLFYRAGGGATQEGSTTAISEIESNVAWAFDLDTDSNDIRSLVTGEAATTINWRAHVELMSID